MSPISWQNHIGTNITQIFCHVFRMWQMTLKPKENNTIEYEALQSFVF